MLLASCTYQGITDGVNSQHCEAVQESCKYNGIYDEWIREDGETTCSCRQI
jgi:hypothetical protein